VTPAPTFPLMTFRSFALKASFDPSVPTTFPMPKPTVTASNWLGTAAVPAAFVPM
jgi:hypothetical protein